MRFLLVSLFIANSFASDFWDFDPLVQEPQEDEIIVYDYTDKKPDQFADCLVVEWTQTTVRCITIDDDVIMTIIE